MTPTTEHVRAGYVLGAVATLEKLGIEPPAGTVDGLKAEFDRWYAEEIRKAKEQAWDEGFTKGFYSAQVLLLDSDACESPINNPYMGGLDD